MATITIRTFDGDTEADTASLVNEYTRGWRYSRAVGKDLVAYWKTLAGAYQPQNMLIAYRDGARAFAHGERRGDECFVHLLALAPGGAEAGLSLLQELEARARAAGARRLCGPTCRSGVFYGGYLLGLEPYHPHWAVEATDVFVRAGFAISQSDTLMVAERPAARAEMPLPDGYRLQEAEASAEFEAQTFRLVALNGDEAASHCGGRLYPRLATARGGVIGQLGPVETEAAHRRKGLASALVQLALNRLWERGAEEALISTGLENTSALRAYERAGFVRRHYLMEWSKVLL